MFYFNGEEKKETRRVEVPPFGETLVGKALLDGMQFFAVALGNLLGLLYFVLVLLVIYLFGYYSYLCCIYSYNVLQIEWSSINISRRIYNFQIWHQEMQGWANISAEHAQARAVGPALDLVTTFNLVTFIVSAAKNLIYVIRRFLLPASKVCVRKTRLLLERAIAGSAPSRGVQSPRFQCEIRSVGGALIGQGFRASVGGQDVIVTALHNVDDEVMIQSPAGKVLIKRDDFKLRPQADVAFLPYEGRVSVLALGKAKLQAKSETQMASIHSNGEGTIGCIEDLSMFGLVKYTGTTYPGYSGAPYFFGNNIFGVHLGTNGTINFGLEATYLEVLIQVDAEVENPAGVEDSEDFLYGQLTRGKKGEWKATGDPDQISVKMNGKYHLVDITSDIGGKINKFFRGGLERIPEQELPQVEIPVVEDQVNGSFLGQRPALLLRSTPSTSTAPSPIPQTQTSVSAGPSQERTQPGNHSTSTTQSHVPGVSTLTRKRAVECLLQLYPSLKPGDQQEVSLALTQSLSRDGLLVLLTRLQRNSTGPAQ